MWVKAELLSDASKLFDEMSNRNTVSFVTSIQGCLRFQQFDEAVELFSRLHWEPIWLYFDFESSCQCGWADLGWTVQACIYELVHDSNTFVGTGLIDAYWVYGCTG
ncbi:hypothetical protein SLA2020_121490 [Shorea laevis]